MIYLAKIAIRRKILGLDAEKTIVEEKEEAADAMETDDDPGFATSEDVIAIPAFKENTLRPSMIEGVEVDSEAKKDPMTTPALNGAIPLAIFDAARKQPFFCAAAAEAFFDMFATFTQVRCLPRILQHVLDCLIELYPKDALTWNCYVRQSFIGVDFSSPEFPVALGTALDRLKEAKEKTKDRDLISKKTRQWIEPMLEVQDLDPGIQTVLTHTLRKLE